MQAKYEYKYRYMDVNPLNSLLAECRVAQLFQLRKYNAMETTICMTNILMQKIMPLRPAKKYSYITITKSNRTMQQNVK